MGERLKKKVLAISLCDNVFFVRLLRAKSDS